MMVPISLLVLVAVLNSVICCKSDQYEVITANLTWSEAFIECKQRNLILATIESQSVQDELDKFLNTCNIKPGWDDGLWISLRQVARHWKSWYWVANGILAEYFNWGPGQPDSKRDLCTEVYIADSGKWKWNNVPCEKDKYRYRALCQKPKCDISTENKDR